MGGNKDFLRGELLGFLVSFVLDKFILMILDSKVGKN